MLDEKDIWMQRERYADLLREAERERIIQRALGREKRIPFRERSLGWLGLCFEACSCYLQRRDAFGVFDGKEVVFRGVAAIASDHGCV